MIYYTEPIKRRDNARGRSRMYSDLGGIAIASGQNADGTLRYFRTEKKLTELPGGVVEIRESEYLEGIAEYEASIPPPEPTQRQLDRTRLRELKLKARESSLVALEREEVLDLIIKL